MRVVFFFSCRTLNKFLDDTPQQCLGKKLTKTYTLNSKHDETAPTIKGPTSDNDVSVRWNTSFTNESVTHIVQTAFSGTHTATDNCDASLQLEPPEVKAVTGFDLADRNVCYDDKVVGKYAVTYSATDVCGNLATHVVHTYTIEDKVKPTFTPAAPAGISYTASASMCANGSVGETDTAAIKDAVLANVTASDDRDGTLILTPASNVDLAPIEVVPLSSGYVAATITATITAADSCGNAASVTRTVALTITDPPTSTNNPPAASNTCGAWPMAAPTAPVFTAACTLGDMTAGVTVTRTIVNGTTASGRQTRTYTWQAVDALGNTAWVKHTQTAASCGTSWASGNCTRGVNAGSTCATFTNLWVATTTCVDVAGKNYPFPWGWMVVPAVNAQLPLYQGAAQKTQKESATCHAITYSSTTAGTLVGYATYTLSAGVATVTVKMCAGGIFADGSEQIKACWAPDTSLTSANACSGGSGNGASIGKFPIKKTCTANVAGATCTFTATPGANKALWLHVVSFFLF